MEDRLREIKISSEIHSYPEPKDILGKRFLYVNAMNILIVAILYTINRFILKVVFIEKFNIFFNHYFNDLIVPIVLLSFIDFLLFNKINRVTLFYIKISTMFLASIFWEFVTPLYLNRSVSDIYDLFMYFLGTVIYFGIDYIEK